LLKFEVSNWLSGHEYAFILRHYRAYLECYPEKIQIAEKGHPMSIYETPKGNSFQKLDCQCSWSAVLYQRLAPERVWIP